MQLQIRMRPVLDATFRRRLYKLSASLKIVSSSVRSLQAFLAPVSLYQRVPRKSRLSQDNLNLHQLYTTSGTPYVVTSRVSRRGAAVLTIRPLIAPS